MYRYMYLYECSSCLNGYIRILAVNGIHRCIDLYISIYLYIYMRSPKNLGRRYIVGVDVLDLTHINFRKVGIYIYIYCDCESLQLLPTWSG